MLRDWGSRDGSFVELNTRVRSRIVDVAGVGGDFVCVPVQGSGTFAIEAAIGTLVPRDGKLLIVVNGAYGRRMARICDVIGRDHVVIETAEDTPPDLAMIERSLQDDPAISDVVAVHCETTSGILNPIGEIAELTAAKGRRLMIDAMSSFGALDLAVGADSVIASSNKCLEGVPGVGFVVIRQSLLAASAGNAHSLALDLHDQWQAFERNGQWRFTPPTHVVAALDRALQEHAEEGGVAGRRRRYQDNCRVLIDGMRALGFDTYLPDALQAPIIVTFHTPKDPSFDFQRFYALLEARGYVIYPGKLTQVETFRIGCIGRVGASEMHGVLEAVAAALAELGVRECGRQAA